MLVGKGDRLVDEGELIVLPAQPPENISGGAADLRHLVHVAAGNDDVPVGVDVDRVAVDVVHQLRRQGMGNDVRDLEVVPTAPLEHYVSVPIQLLNDQAMTRASYLPPTTI